MHNYFGISSGLRTLLFGVTEGILFASLFVNARDAMREDAFFRAIANRVTATSQTPEERVLTLMHKCHDMLLPLQRSIETGELEDFSEITSYNRLFFKDIASEVLFPKGRCGSFAGVFLKLLKSEGFPVRFGQMLDRDDVTGTTCHVLVEVRLDGRWVICDPYYDLVFRGDDGRILGFDEIRRDWDRVKAQCPPDYNMDYAYRGFRRVNFGALNAVLQKTPLASWSVRTWLMEGAWLRVAIVGLLLAVVVAIHVWFERSARSLGFQRRAA